MSKIIKAAHLRVLVADDEVFRSVEVGEPTEEDHNNQLHDQILAEATEQAAAIVEDARNEAAAMVEEANKQAAKLLDDARKQATEESSKLRKKATAEGRKEGKAAGHKEGVKQGEDEMAAKASSALSVLDKIVEEATQGRARALAQLEEDLLKLALLVAEKMIRREISDDPLWLRPVIDEAMARLAGAESVTVRLNPRDYAVLTSEEWMGIASRTSVSFQPNEGITQGSFFIETEYGAIDASFERRLGQIAASLMDVIYRE